MRLGGSKSILITAGLIPVLSGLTIAQKNPDSVPLPLTVIVQDMEKAQSEGHAQSAFQVIREYRLSGAKNTSANVDVVAEMNFNPPTSKDYRIQKWAGSMRGKQVVQRILDHEIESSKGNQARTALTTDNYDFVPAGEAVFDGQPCYVLGLKPKRKEKDLVSGAAWVDKRTFFVRHIEGDTARAPSWWVKSVHIKMTFGGFSGAWLQTNMEAVAEVRLLGSHTLTCRSAGWQGWRRLAGYGAGWRT